MAFFPEEASTIAGRVDALFFTLLGFSVALTAVLFFLLAYFAARYRKGSQASRAGRIKKTYRYELLWSAVPLVIALGLFSWGADLYLERTHIPADALAANGIAKQWMWKFQHPGGRREINELHIPVGRPVALRLISQDVIHSFYVPAFRVKQDVLPGRYTTVWFEATEPGVFYLFCAEYCGTDHSGMRGHVVALSPGDYEAWLSAGRPESSLAAQGERLFRAHGCSGCHGAGSQVRAPPLADVFGRPVPLAGGGFVTADESYLRDSILLPNKQIVAGYRADMPSFRGRIGEGDLLKIIEYLKSLSRGEG